MDVRRIFDNPWVFGVSQRLIPFTVWVYEELFEKHVAFRTGDRVLDVGCGLGAHRRLLDHTDYTGIDLNARYIARATRIYGPGFLVMDARKLDFPDGSFDGAVSIATFHHLGDDVVRAAIGEALRVIRPGGSLHVIDPVLPLDAGAHLKRFVFLNDRGRHQRTLSAMTDLIAVDHPIAERDLRSGVLHDVAYFRIQQ